jgi:hypothetical protein
MFILPLPLRDPSCTQLRTWQICQVDLKIGQPLVHPRLLRLVENDLPNGLVFKGRVILDDGDHLLGNEVPCMIDIANRAHIGDSAPLTGGPSPCLCLLSTR